MLMQAVMTAAFVLGGALVTLGAGLVYVPAGFIVGGLFLLWTAIRWASSIA